MTLGGVLYNHRSIKVKKTKVGKIIIIKSTNHPALIAEKHLYCAVSFSISYLNLSSTTG